LTTQSYFTPSPPFADAAAVATAGIDPSADVMAVASIPTSALTSSPEALSLKLPGLPSPITAVKNSGLSHEITPSPEVAAAIASEAVAAAAVATTREAVAGATAEAAVVVEVPAVAQPALWVGDVDGSPAGYSAVVMVSSESGGTTGYIRNVDPATGKLTLYLVSLVGPFQFKKNIKKILKILKVLKE
jgi:hypothetical protein